MAHEVDCPARTVWVLLFDQLQTEDADRKYTKPSAAAEATPSIDPVFGPFDDLDLQSSFFEQYMLQDARDSATATDILGGIEPLRRFNARIRAAGKSASTVRLLCVNAHLGDSTVSQPQENFLSDHEASARCIERTIHGLGDQFDHFDESVFHADSALRSALTTDLVWIEARTGIAEGSQAAAGRILQLIQRLRFETMLTSSALPVLIVSSIHGYKRELASPFASGLSESQTHVPLWIDHGAGHACRIQALTGSSDILPTLAEYLTGAGPIPEDSALAIKNLTGTSVQLSGRPLSLVSACEHHKPLPDRLLPLTGNSWKALRTQQYLLVQPRSQENAACDSEASPDESSRTARRLYLKPDDVWNVNDAVVSYAEIANQMEATAAESARNADESGR